MSSRQGDDASSCKLDCRPGGGHIHGGGPLGVEPKIFAGTVPPLSVKIEPENGVRHIPMAVPLGETGGRYLMELFEYPPQFKVGFMSNNPLYDIIPEAKMAVKAWLKKHGFGRLTP